MLAATKAVPYEIEILVFSMVCFVPLAFFARGAGRRRNAGQHEAP